jgi:ParB/RepB/Spo0J family partition protein
VSAKHSFEGADLSIDGPPKFDLGAVVEDPAAVKHGGNAPLSDFEEDPNNTRVEFLEADTQKMIASMRRRGVLQPLHVVRQETGKLRIVVGHRRFRAAQALGLTHLPWIPAFENSLSLLARLEENAVREDIQPMDKAKAIHEVMETGLSRKEVAEQIGLDVTTVTHLLALLKLPPFLRAIYDSQKCRGPKYLYDLRRLHDKNPTLVEQRCQTADVIDSRVIRSLEAAVFPADEAADAALKTQSNKKSKKAPKPLPSAASVARGRFSFKGKPAKILRIIAKLDDGSEYEVKGGDLAKFLWAAAAD